MSHFYEDKFSVGEIITWRDDVWAQRAGGQARYGNGPFQITEVLDQPESHWESMAHTQHVKIKFITPPIPQADLPLTWISGAFFKAVAVGA